MSGGLVEGAEFKLFPEEEEGEVCMLECWRKQKLQLQVSGQSHTYTPQPIYEKQCVGALACRWLDAKMGIYKWMDGWMDGQFTINRWRGKKAAQLVWIFYRSSRVLIRDDEQE